MGNSIWLEEFGRIDTDIPFYVFAIMTGLTLVLCCLNIFSGCCVSGIKWVWMTEIVWIRMHVLFRPGSSMDFYIAIGSLLIDLCILIQGLNPGWLDSETFCKIYPTCMLLGLTMFLGGLMVKEWANFSFYKWNTSKKAVSISYNHIAFIMIISFSVADQRRMEAECVDLAAHHPHGSLCRRLDSLFRFASGQGCEYIS
mgnify:CR=1 FL=1